PTESGARGILRRAVSRDGVDAAPAAARAPTRRTYSPGSSGAVEVSASRNVRPPRGTVTRPLATVTSAAVVSVAVASKPSFHASPTTATPPISPTTHRAADAALPGFQPAANCNRSGTSRAYTDSGAIAASIAWASASAAAVLGSL